MGYRDKTLRFDFPELVDDGESCFVEMRNPKLSSRDELVAAAGEDSSAASKRIVAAHVINWRVFDRESDEELPLPDAGNGAELMTRLPFFVYGRMDKALAEAFPQ